MSSPSSPETARSNLDFEASADSPISSVSSALVVTSCESDSRTIGKTPRPIFPVDSAISCSTQSPKPEIAVPSGTKPSLSLYVLTLEVRAIAAPRIRPGLVSKSSDKNLDAAIALFSKASTSTPARAVGTTPKAVSAE